MVDIFDMSYLWNQNQWRAF